MPYHYLDEAEAAETYRLPTIHVDVFAPDELVEMGVEPDMIPANESWMVCIALPGCLPDSDWFGPYTTEEDAVTDARKLFAME